LDMTRHTQFRAVQRVQPDLAFGPNDAELVAWDARIPAHIDNAVDTAVELYDNSRRVLDAHGVNRVGCDAGGAARTAKEEIQGVDAVGGNVVERTASGQRWVAQPGALFALEPAVAVGLRKDGLADGALRDELP